MRCFLLAVIAIAVVFGLVSVCGRCVAVSQKYEYWTSGEEGASSIYGDRWRGQSFTSDTGHTITSVKLKLYRLNSPGTFYVSIRATDSQTGLPSGNDLCSGSVNGNDFTTSTSGSWEEISLGDGYELSADVTYVIIVRAPNGDSSNKAYARMDYDSTYPDGDFMKSDNGDSSWYLDTGVYMFEEWGEPLAVVPTVVTDNATNVGSSSATLNGQVTATGGATVTERGFEWGESTGSYTDNWSEQGSYGVGSFDHVESTFDPETQYFYRAFAVNSAGIAYGSEKDFTTGCVKPGAPTSLEAVVDGEEVTLTWVTGSNGTFDVVYRFLDDPPVSMEGGYAVYSGDNQTFCEVVMGLGRMDVYYGVWSVNSCGNSTSFAYVLTGGDELEALGEVIADSVVLFSLFMASGVLLLLAVARRTWLWWLVACLPAIGVVAVSDEFWVQMTGAGVMCVAMIGMIRTALKGN